MRVADISVPYGFTYQGGLRDPVQDLALTSATGLRAIAAGVAQGQVLALSPDPAGAILPQTTAKALASAFGRVHFAMTCTASMSHRAIARVLSAVVESGAWCCLDRVEALLPEVLSQMAQQIFEVRAWGEWCLSMSSFIYNYVMY